MMNMINDDEYDEYDGWWMVDDDGWWMMMMDDGWWMMNNECW